MFFGVPDFNFGSKFYKFLNITPSEASVSDRVMHIFYKQPVYNQQF